MTVRCLNRVQKNTVVRMYLKHDYTVSQLAQIYRVSRKTIYCVLDERQVQRPRRIRNRTIAVTRTVTHDAVKQPSFFQRISATFKRAFTPVPFSQ